ncbi:hypothetical protein GOP47_0003061 [Adiantum capillus-veneris]|uniref:Uncharacterized protein n=1 Tax=Adiantum capillus-veneris TaxID=13818 RepID=A0A9D4ZPR6_ADICA|nr:hypothetical protein GOP47_0003061 [Adiantum capillus-veneris]
MGRQDSGRLEPLDCRGRRELADFEKKDEPRGSEHRHHQEKQESNRPDVDKQESWRRPVEKALFEEGCLYVGFPPYIRSKEA